MPTRLTVILLLLVSLRALAVDDPAKVAKAADQFAKALRTQSVSSLGKEFRQGITNAPDLAKQIVDRFPESAWVDMLLEMRGALGHSDPGVRELAVDILATIGPRRSDLVRSFAPELRQRLADPNEKSSRVLGNSISILAGLDAKASLPALEEFQARTNHEALKAHAESAVKFAKAIVAAPPGTAAERLVRCRAGYGAVLGFSRWGLPLGAVALWSLTPSTAHGQMPATYTTEPVNGPHGLVRYLTALGPEFAKELSKLGKGAHWIDVGAGGAWASQEYLSTTANTDFDKNDFKDRAEVKELKKIYTKALEDRAKITAITFDPQRDVPTFNGSLVVYRGKDFSGVLPWEITRERGTPDIITDINATFSRTNGPAEMIKLWAKMIKPDTGRIYISGDDLKTFEVKLKSGTKVNLGQWLLSLNQGVTVTGPADGSGPYEIRRKKGVEVVVPHLALTSNIRKPPRKYDEQDPE